MCHHSRWEKFLRLHFFLFARFQIFTYDDATLALIAAYDHISRAFARLAVFQRPRAHVAWLTIKDYPRTGLAQLVDILCDRRE